MSKLNVLQVLVGKIKNDYNPQKDSTELNLFDKNKNILNDFGDEKSKVFKICVIENKELDYFIFIIDDKKLFLNTNPDEENINWDKINDLLRENTPKDPDDYRWKGSYFLQNIIRSSWESQLNYSDVVEYIRDWGENVSYAITTAAYSDTQSIPVDISGSSPEFDFLSLLQQMDKGNPTDYFDPSNCYLLEIDFASNVECPTENSEALEYESVVNSINAFDENKKVLILTKLHQDS
jgi:hypothetical protein